MEVNVNGVSITLTQDQVNQIAEQTRKYKIEDIDYPLACKILKEQKLKRFDFKRKHQWDIEQLEMIIKACNFVDNNNTVWSPNFDDVNQKKYYLWFKKSAGVWSVLDDYWLGDVAAGVSFGFYFKDRKTARIIGAKRTSLFNLENKQYENII